MLRDRESPPRGGGGGGHLALTSRNETVHYIPAKDQINQIEIQEAEMKANLGRAQLTAAIEACGGAGHDLHEVVLAGTPLDLAHQGLDIPEAVCGRKSQRRPALRLQAPLLWKSSFRSRRMLRGPSGIFRMEQFPGCCPEGMLQIPTCNPGALVHFLLLIPDAYHLMQESRRDGFSCNVTASYGDVSHQDSNSMTAGNVCRICQIDITGWVHGLS